MGNVFQTVGKKINVVRYFAKGYSGLLVMLGERDGSELLMKRFWLTFQHTVPAYGSKTQ
jgi:hypothetical protein